LMQHAGPSTRINELGGHRALPSDRASHYSLECDGVFARSVNQRSAHPHHGGSRHDRRPIDRGIPDRQIGLRQNFGGWAGPRQTADQPVEGCSGLRRHRLPDLLPLPPSESCRRANSAPTG
jgi:hypothetical protein